MNKFMLLLGTLGFWGCFSNVPVVDEIAFACLDDRANENGLLQCPASHWCYEGSCKPRLGCTAPWAERPACEEFVERCELSFSAEVAAVSCEPGVHTVTTSTRPSAIDTCDCPDGTWCVAYGEGLSSTVAESHPLIVLPPVQDFPVGKLGFKSERRGLRVCVRGCSGELDCPGAHTCRAAVVYDQSFALNEDLGRHTLGVCYPDRINTQTATSSELPVLPKLPDPDVCLAQSDCRDRQIAFEVCQIVVAVLPDHPTVPAGEGWGERMALVSRCVQPISGGLVVVDGGCDEGSECESGICHNQRCVRLCDPSLIEPCPGGRSCNETQVLRPVRGDAREVRDRIWLCSGH